ncbi:hypothetical protein DPMN_047876 [Dreissena polymorpha]|uniref:Uncharacterized protein n=1 Tax=Dreissena polymorpha TaxID=45954 RepID=A0A9D4DB77_DREPO|nr:hypothetical protein DPMN_047876 [Dreissena polymorpha]
MVQLGATPQWEISVERLVCKTQFVFNVVDAPRVPGQTEAPCVRPKFADTKLIDNGDGHEMVN